LKKTFDQILTTLQLFGNFWNCHIFCQICIETNYYATEQLVFIKYGENGEEVEEFYTHGRED